MTRSRTQSKCQHCQAGKLHTLAEHVEAIAETARIWRAIREAKTTHRTRAARVRTFARQFAGKA